MDDTMAATRSFGGSLDRHLKAVARKRQGLPSPQIRVYAHRLGIDYRSANADATFHAASIGKMPAAVLIMQLVESGALTLNTPVSELLPDEEVRGLFTVDSGDHAALATVERLLAHTSGVADYFDGPVTTGSRVRDLMLSEREHRWTPKELLDFTRERQYPVGAPGARFSYSDTGYIVLGRIVEEITGRDYHDALHARIFEPLGMRDSYLPFRTRPSRAVETGTDPELQPLWINGEELSRANSISADWAGGGIATTPDDLLAFSIALHEGRLISGESLTTLQRVQNRFRRGIHYGAGMMELHFGEFFFALRGMPRLSGHIGVLATHLFHDPVHDAHIVLNFHSTREMKRSFRTLITIERRLTRSLSD